jgi:hypothetical protein
MHKPFIKVIGVLLVVTTTIKSILCQIVTSSSIMHAAAAIRSFATTRAMEINPLAHISEQREPHENIQVDV